MATRLKVTYADGRDVVVLVSPRAQVETERKFPDITASPIQVSFFLAWASLFYAGQDRAEFDTWLDSIQDVNEAEPEVVDPTRPTPRPDTSSS